MKWIFLIFFIFLFTGCTNPLQMPKTYHPLVVKKSSNANTNNINQKEKKIDSINRELTHNNNTLNNTYLFNDENRAPDVLQEKNFQIKSLGQMTASCTQLSCLKHLNQKKDFIVKKNKKNYSSNKNQINFFKSGTSYYTVKPHDTLYSISKHLHVSLRALINANHLNPPYNLHIGQLLILIKYKSHVVQKGETVYSIARKYNVSIASLVEENNIMFPFTIKAGVKLIIPDSLIVLHSTKPVKKSSQMNVSHAHFQSDLLSQKKVSRIKKLNMSFMLSRSNTRFLWPIHGKILVSFGKKDHGVIEKGIRISAPKGTFIHAADNGVVVYSGNRIRGFGTLMLIKHANNYLTAYAHASQSLVHRGEIVHRGQIIGSVGNISGKSELDFQIRKGTHILNPIQYLAR